MPKFVPNGQLVVQPMTKMVRDIKLPPGVADGIADQILDAANDIVNRAMGTINRNYLAARQRYDLSGLAHQRYTRQFVGGEMDILFSFANEKVTLRMRPQLQLRPPGAPGPEEPLPEFGKDKDKLSYPIFWPEEGFEWAVDVSTGTTVTSPYDIEFIETYTSGPTFNKYRGGVGIANGRFRGDIEVSFGNNTSDSIIFSRYFTPGEYAVTAFESLNIEWFGWTSGGAPEPSQDNLVGAFALTQSPTVANDDPRFNTRPPGLDYEGVIGGYVAKLRHKFSPTPLFSPPSTTADYYQGQTAAATQEFLTPQFTVEPIYVPNVETADYRDWAQLGSVTLSKPGYFPEGAYPGADLDSDGFTDSLARGNWVIAAPNCYGRFVFEGTAFPVGYVTFELG